MATTRTAKKAAQTRRDTAETTAPARKTPAKKTTRKPAAKKTLPTRPRDWMTDAQGFAVLAARIVGINTPRIQDWTDHHDGTVTRALNDGTLHYTVATRTLRWQATCRMGAVHTYLITDPGMAMDARMRAATCTQLHADLTGIPALTDAERAELGIATSEAITLAGPIPGVPEITETIPVPMPERRERSLGDALTRATTATADTQPIPVLAADETPKEHPQP
jgi:hypothetical protein